VSGIDVSRFVSTRSPAERTGAPPRSDDKGTCSSEALGNCRKSKLRETKNIDHEGHDAANSSNI
jgi:hypothetical protein